MALVGFENQQSNTSQEAPYTPRRLKSTGVSTRRSGQTYDPNASQRTPSTEPTYTSRSATTGTGVRRAGTTAVNTPSPSRVSPEGQDRLANQQTVQAPSYYTNRQSGQYLTWADWLNEPNGKPSMRPGAMANRNQAAMPDIGEPVIEGLRGAIETMNSGETQYSPYKVLDALAYLSGVGQMAEGTFNPYAPNALEDFTVAWADRFGMSEATPDEQVVALTAWMNDNSQYLPMLIDTSSPTETVEAPQTDDAAIQAYLAQFLPDYVPDLYAGTGVVDTSEVPDDQAFNESLASIYGF